MVLSLILVLLLVCSIAFAVVSVMKWIEASRHLKNLRSRFGGIIDVERHKSLLQQEFENEKAAMAKSKAELATLKNEVVEMKRQLSIYGQDIEVAEHGLYVPMFDFTDSARYKVELENLRLQEKEMIKDGSACRCGTTWSVNGSEAEGRKQTKHYSKLMLRAYNGEADAALADIRWNNIQRMLDRLESSFEAINKMGSTHSMAISRLYADLKIRELHLAFGYEERLKAEKDEQRRIQAEMREEEKAQRDIDRALKEAYDNESRYQRALDKARADLQQAQGAQVERLNEAIASLNARLAEALQAKERAKSMAEMTKSGHVYVISNIGSFGEHTYKIGMTRRLDPMDRVHELGDASVPFSFDVHAMIYSENAPELEAKLHRQFAHKRVNMVNERKEFFQVTLEEISAIVRKQHATIEFVMDAEAREYRETMGRRSAPSRAAS